MSVRLLFVGLFVACAFFACGSDPAPPKCAGGASCTCEGFCAESCGGSGERCTMECAANAKCNFECPKGNCFFECGPGSTCNLGCKGGSCTGTCDGTASCALDCPGNNCNLTCRGSPTCRISSCKNFCALDCGGAQTCETSCSPAPGGCTKK
jgi:hypothetical protein